jgi:thioester reductase-like protein
VAVEADVTKPDFGLPRREYDLLAERIDHVVHGAAVVSWVAPYRVLAPTNVEGTKRVIRFALSGKPKALTHISSAGVYASRENLRDGFRTAQLPLTQAGDFVNEYSATKWVADRLVTESRSNLGLLANVIRPPQITCSADCGISPSDDFITLMLQTSVQIGLLPRLVSLLPMAAVDGVAAGVVDLAVGHESGIIANIGQPLKIDGELLKRLLARFSRSVECCSIAEWLAAARKQPTAVSAVVDQIAFFAEVSKERELLIQSYSWTPRTEEKTQVDEKHFAALLKWMVSKQMLDD